MSTIITFVCNVLLHRTCLPERISVRVIDPFTIKPLDIKTIIDHARVTRGRILTVEDHYNEGRFPKTLLLGFCTFNNHGKPTSLDTSCWLGLCYWFVPAGGLWFPWAECHRCAVLAFAHWLRPSCFVACLRWRQGAVHCAFCKCGSQRGRVLSAFLK